MKPWLKWTLIALPLVVGGYIVYRKLRKDDKPEMGGDDMNTPPPSPTPTPKPAPTPKPDFPMGVGSRGAKVKELQQAIIDNASADVVKLLGKSGADGIFGTGTEKAVKAVLGKTTVANQADIDRIKAMKSAAQTSQTRLALARKQVELFKAGKGDFYAINPIQVASGEVTSDGRDIKRIITVYQTGQKLPISKYASFEISSQGFIRAEKGISDTRLNFYEWSPIATEIK